MTRGDLQLRGRVLVAAGPWSDGGDPARLGDVVGAGVGAVVTKTVTAAPRPGLDGPELVGSVRVPVNRVGLRGPGAAAFTAEQLPRLTSVLGAVPLVVSVAGSADELAGLAAWFAGEAGVAGLEVNVSCPNGGSALAPVEPADVSEQVAAVRGAWDGPLLVKLPPDPWRVAALARAAVAAGADVVVQGNSLPALVVAGDERWAGGLTGPTIQPLALRCVAEVRAALPDVLLVGCGGVATVDDVARFRAAGADAVAVGSAHLTVPDAAVRLARELADDAAHRGGAPRRNSRLAGASADERLRVRTAATGGVGLCIGLDPDPALLPWHLGSLDVIDAVERQLTEVLDATVDLAAAVKPNAAFFEALGSEGWALLERVVRRLPPEVPVILDAKRGDIGSTARRYADAAFDGLDADAVTVSPYLGADAVAPFVARPERLAFVLAATSNPGAGALQAARSSDGEPLFERVVRTTAPLGSNVGFVAGATQLDRLGRVRTLAPGAWLLVPGVGAQGGDLAAAVGLAGPARADRGGLLVNASRSVVGASRGRDHAEAARAAAELLDDQIHRCTHRTAGATRA